MIYWSKPAINIAFLTFKRWSFKQTFCFVRPSEFWNLNFAGIWQCLIQHNIYFALMLCFDPFYNTVLSGYHFIPPRINHSFGRKRKIINAFIKLVFECYSYFSPGLWSLIILLQLSSFRGYIWLHHLTSQSTGQSLSIWCILILFIGPISDILYNSGF